MAKRTRYTPEFKAAVVLEALSGESSKQNSAGDITSANNNSRSGSSKRLKTLRLCLAPRIKRQRRMRRVSLTLSNSLGVSLSP